MRLTEKTAEGYALNRNLLRPEHDVLLVAKDVTDKLGQLEDIEDELGIDLITLIKALNNGIWVYRGKRKEHTSWCIAINGNGDGGHRKTTFWLSYKVNGFDFPDYYEHLEFKDYGKTWALTKEELL